MWNYFSKQFKFSVDFRVRFNNWILKEKLGIEENT